MKKVLFSLIMFSYVLAQAQFSPCTDNIQIINGQQWSASHGSPSWAGNGNSVWVWSIANRGEGVNYSGFNFVQGREYCVSFTLNASTHNGQVDTTSTMNVVLTQGAVIGQVTTMNGGSFPSVPNPSQSVMGQNIWSNGGNTQTYSFNFVANQNFNNIWFYPKKAQFTHPQVEVRISDLEICTAPKPVFNLEATCEDGEFCVTVTTSYPTSGNDWWGLMETFVPGSTLDIHTVDADPNTSPSIDPVAIQYGASATFCGLDITKSYYIKHGITYSCFGWEEVREVVPETLCCKGEFDASFDSSQNTTGTIGVLSFNPNLNNNAVNEWYVVSSPNANSGPYTPVYSTVFNGPAPFTLINNAQPNLFYTIIHKVINDCEELCSTNVHYFNKSGKTTEQKGSSNIDCSIVDQLFPPCSLAPINLQVVGNTLTWNPVAGAVSYIVRILPSNVKQIACGCKSGSGVAAPGVSVGTNTNSYVLPSALINKCFAWEVIAVCDGGNSQKSLQACYNKNKSIEFANDDNDTLKIYPNPNNGEMNIKIATIKGAVIDIYRFDGTLVKTLKGFDVKENTLTLDLRALLNKGIYFFIFNNGEKRITKQVIIE